MTSTMSSSVLSVLAGLLVSSIMTVSLSLSLLGGVLVLSLSLSLVLLISMTSLADRLEGGLRGDDRRLLGERECRRMTSSSTTDERLGPVPRPMHV